MKKFFGEFKKFITRGNVLDLAVGVIIGSAFTAIVNALTKNILQPLINWIIFLISGSEGSLEGVYTFLVGDSTDLTKAIYIDWGAFLSAIINFLLIAFVLFMIVKTINKINEKGEKIRKQIKKGMLSKDDRKALKKLGIKVRDEEKVKAYLLEKAEKAEEAKRLEEERIALEKAQNPSVEQLLKDIKVILEKKI